MKKEMLHSKVDFANIREMIDWTANKHNSKTAFSFKQNPLDKEIT